MQRYGTFLLMITGIILVCCVLHLQAQPKAVLLGIIRNPNNAPVNFVSVQIVETKEGRLTNKQGQFTFATSTEGTVTVRIKHNSFEPLEQVVVLHAGDTTRLEIVLYPKLVTLKAAVVGASAFSSSDEVTTVTMRPLDVATTPGAAADIFRALQTFPGVANIDDGSTLIVRGGDASETVSLLDQATIARPYRFETPTGGTFGTIPPFFVSGMMFTSGGFPARYGNAMSAVLAMESQNIPTMNQMRLNGGIFGASAGVDWIAVPGEVGVRFSGNRSDAGLILSMNGTQGEFPRMPRGYDANLSVSWKYSGTGKIKFFNYVTNDDVAVRINRALPAEGANVFSNNATNRIHSVQWSEVFGDNWLVKSSLSWNMFTSQKDIGAITIKPTEQNMKIRTDVEKDVNDNVRILFGAEAERDDYTFRLVNGTTTPYTESAASMRVGGYTELEAKLGRAWLLGAGVRADYHSLSERYAIDPRVSVQYALTEAWNLRASWGRYSQFASLYSYNAASGNTTLAPQNAEHQIISLNYQEDQWLFRAEVYNKLYRDLVLPANTGNTGNLGTGYARGVDLFLKYGAYLVTPTSGWISYSYLQSERTQTVRNHGEQFYQNAPSPFDLTHNLTIVWKQEITRRLLTGMDNLAAGFTFHYGTGAPVTPIVGGERQADGSFTPVYGAIASERLPNFVRLDLNVSYYTPFQLWGTEGTLVVFSSLNNITNTVRTIGYEYSPDYTERFARVSLSRRTCILGFVATLKL